MNGTFTAIAVLMSVRGYRLSALMYFFV